MQVPLSVTRTFDRLVFVSGQVGRRPDSGTIPEGFGDQMRQAIGNLAKALDEAGSSLHRILKVTVFIRRQEDFEEMNRIYAELLEEPYPARTTIVTALARPNVDFEIEAIAYVEG